MHPCKRPHCPKPAMVILDPLLTAPSWFEGGEYCFLHGMDELREAYGRAS